MISTTITPIKRALISVSDKAGVAEFVSALIKLDIEVISTGGTSQLLREAQLPHKQIDDFTGLPAMLDGRVKTLHPKVHGGILGRRDQHADEAKQHNIEWIDLVVVNFYPFARATQDQQLTDQEAIEYVDIGGPTMVRAAAKNFAWVTVITDPNDYALVLDTIAKQGGTDMALRKQLATKVFQRTAHYDAMIAQHFLQQTHDAMPPLLTLPYEKITDLRYGENPHQSACAYRNMQSASGILSAKQHQGKPLSYNNILDAEAALTAVQTFEEPTCVIVKHANPCGVASSDDINHAYALAYAADALSAFGGIVALNRPCTAEIAMKVSAIFMEVIIAPTFSEEALQILATKPNLRVLSTDAIAASSKQPTWELRFVSDGLLMQERDTKLPDPEQWQIATAVKPSPAEIENLLFAWRVLKYVKSNAILIAKNKQTVGIGAGQVSRVDAVEMAIRKAGQSIQGSVLASDAFFPFRDSIDLIAHTGIRAIIQPGGSIKDKEVIAACDEHGISMLFTGLRCFRH